MKKITNIFKLMFILGMVATTTPALASEYSGIISTGLGTGIQGIVISAPIANPTAGTYSSTQNITLSAQGSSSIRYTIDNSVPTCSIGTVYTTSISVSSSQTIKAIACYADGSSSVVATLQYIINQAGGGGGGGGGGGSYILHKTGDIDGDGIIGMKDFNMLMVNWGKSGSSMNGDVNGDQKVDLSDFNILMVNWGK